MLIAVRHGATKFNGADGERSRGWLDIPVTPEGMQAVQRTAQGLAALRGHISGPVLSSDISRAVQSAKPIAQALAKPLQPTPALRDWNVGDMAGQPVKQILPEQTMLLRHKDEPAPGGESYADFMARVGPTLKKLVTDPRAHVIVTHNRVLTLLDALAKGKGEQPDQATLESKGPVHPAGVLVVHPDWSADVLHQGEAAEG